MSRDCDTNWVKAGFGLVLGAGLFGIFAAVALLLFLGAWNLTGKIGTGMLRSSLRGAMVLFAVFAGLIILLNL